MFDRAQFRFAPIPTTDRYLRRIGTSKDWIKRSRIRNGLFANLTPQIARHLVDTNQWPVLFDRPLDVIAFMKRFSDDPVIARALTDQAVRYLASEDLPTQLKIIQEVRLAEAEIRPVISKLCDIIAELSRSSSRVGYVDAAVAFFPFDSFADHFPESVWHALIRCPSTIRYVSRTTREESWTTVTGDWDIKLGEHDRPVYQDMPLTSDQELARSRIPARTTPQWVELCGGADSSGLELLITAATSNDDDVAVAGIAALERLHLGERELKRLVSHRSERVWRAAVAALARGGYSAFAEMAALGSERQGSETVVRALCEMGQQHPRDFAAFCQNATSQVALAVIVSALSSSDEGVRVAAVAAISKRSRTIATPYLQALLGRAGETETVRDAASTVLRRWQGHTPLPVAPAAPSRLDVNDYAAIDAVGRQIEKYKSTQPLARALDRLSLAEAITLVLKLGRFLDPALTADASNLIGLRYGEGVPASDAHGAARALVELRKESPSADLTILQALVARHLAPQLEAELWPERKAAVASLGAIGGAAAIEVLRARLSLELDYELVQEIEAALTEAATSRSPPSS